MKVWVKRNVFASFLLKERAVMTVQKPPILIGRFHKKTRCARVLFYIGGIRRVVSLRIVSRLVVSRFFGSCLGLFFFSVFFLVVSGLVCAKVPKLNTDSNINMINFFIDKNLIDKDLCLLDNKFQIWKVYHWFK